MGAWVELRLVTIASRRRPSIPPQSCQPASPLPARGSARLAVLFVCFWGGRGAEDLSRKYAASPRIQTRPNVMNVFPDG